MDLRSIIIDDEETGIDTLKRIITKYASGVKVVAESSNPVTAIELIEDYRPDVVFLDISMPEMDGFELLANLRWKNFCLVFTTAHQEFALRALKQNAMDYLLKPIDYKELLVTIEKVKQRVSADANKLSLFNHAAFDSLHQLLSQKMAIVSKQSVESVNLPDVVSLESKSNYTLFTFNDSRTILSTKSLKEYESLLCDNLTFMRVHHSYIINLSKVLRFVKEEGDIIMTGGQKIHVARTRRDIFMNWLLDN